MGTVTATDGLRRTVWGLAGYGNRTERGPVLRNRIAAWPRGSSDPRSDPRTAARPVNRLGQRAAPLRGQLPEHRDRQHGRSGLRPHELLENGLPVYVSLHAAINSVRSGASSSAVIDVDVRARKIAWLARLTRDSGHVLAWS